MASVRYLHPHLAAIGQSAAARFHYIVRPHGDAWAVDFGGPRDLFVYASRAEAVAVARGAAMLHWTSRTEPCGVLEDDGLGRLSALYAFGGHAVSP